MAPLEAIFSSPSAENGIFHFSRVRFALRCRFKVYGAKFVNHANGVTGPIKAVKKISSTGIVIAISVG